MRRVVVIALLVAALSAWVWSSTVLAVNVTDEPVSISVSRQIDREAPPPFTATFEPSGTHVQDGLLKARIDIYPSEGSKCYDQYRVRVPARGLTEEEWAMFLSGEPPEETLDEKALNAYIDTEIGWTHRVNPVLCHFIVVEPDMTKAEIEAYIADVFDARLIADLDDIMSREGPTAELASALMRGKNVAVSDLDAARVRGEKEQAVLATKTQLKGLEVSVGATTSVSK